MRSLEDIIPSLIGATESGKLKWGEGVPWDRREPGYSAELAERYTVRVWSWTDADSGTESATVTLVHRGKVIDSVSADKFNPHFEELSRLFSVARRSAKDVDVAISEIDTFLKSKLSM